MQGAERVLNAFGPVFQTNKKEWVIRSIALRLVLDLGTFLYQISTSYLLSKSTWDCQKNEK